MEHELLELAMEEFWDALLDILADQSLLKEDLDTLPVDWPDMGKRQKDIDQSLKSQIGKLEELLKKMEQDPLTDRVTAMEYGAIRENLQELQQDASPRAESGLRAQDKKSAGQAMDEIVSELERQSLLAEDVLQAKREGLKTAMKNTAPPATGPKSVRPA